MLRVSGAERERGFARAEIRARVTPRGRRFEKRAAADRIAVCS